MPGTLFSRISTPLFFQMSPSQWDLPRCCMWNSNSSRNGPNFLCPFLCFIILHFYSNFLFGIYLPFYLLIVCLPSCPNSHIQYIRLSVMRTSLFCLLLIPASASVPYSRHSKNRSLNINKWRMVIKSSSDVLVPWLGYISNTGKLSSTHLYWLWGKSNWLNMEKNSLSSLATMEEKQKQFLNLILC